MLISLIVEIIVIALAYWLISLIPLPSPAPEIIRVIFIIILVIIVLYALLGFLGGTPFVLR